MVGWDNKVDEIIGGDLTAVLGYVTPASGVVISPVAPLGLRDRAASTVSFTTSLGFGRKLERFAENPKMSLAFAAREHGFATSQRYVLVQGSVVEVRQPDVAWVEDNLTPRAERFLGPVKRGRLWDPWLREYYQERVVVTARVVRVTTWPDLHCAGPMSVVGAPLPGDPLPQRRPEQGTGARVNVRKAARQLARSRHRLLGFVHGDGFPFVVPVELAATGPDGLLLETGVRLPPGGRRAGLVGHSYRPELVGLTVHQHTGWMQVDAAGSNRCAYYPHTDRGFRAPPNKTLLLISNGAIAKYGLWQARRAGRERLLHTTPRS